MEIQDVEYNRVNSGWACRVWFWVLTSRQFGDELHSSVGYSAWWLLAFFRAWVKAQRHYRVLRARPGEREAKGWSE